MDWKIKHIKEVKTTVFGIIIFIFTLLLVFMDKADFVDISPVWLVVIHLLLSKDPEIDSSSPTF